MKRIVPSSPQSPPKKSTMGQIVWVNPVSSENFFSSPGFAVRPDTSTAKATHRPSGEKNGPSAFSLPGTIRVSPRSSR